MEKLLKQVGDTEDEIDRLIKLTVKDIWTQELDDFIAEWRSELADEHKRQKKVAHLGRRASNKLKVGPKGPAAKRRKAMGDDPDDSDFETSKPKKLTASKVIKPDPKVTSAFFGQFAAPVKAESKPSKAVLATLQSSMGGDKKPVKAAPKISPVDEMNIDGTSDAPSETDQASRKVKKETKQPTKRAAPTKVPESSSETIQSGPSPMRRPRAAASKPVKYGGDSDSDSDNGDDLLGDVSNMVKGIRETGPDGKPGSRPLFAASVSRPGSSAGLSKMKARPSVKHVLEGSDDETDFSKLIPQSARPRSVVQDAGLDDPNDSFSSTGLGPEKIGSQQARRAGKAAAKPKTAAKATKPPASKASGATATSKKSALSPAAKAYATKQAKKKVIESDSEADEVGAITDDLLDSPSKDDPEEASSPPPRAATNRPARRVVATKKKATYVESDSLEGDSEAEEESDDFSDDD